MRFLRSSKTKRSSKPQNNATTLESLEDRALLSATLNDTTLLVNGSDSADTIVITQDAGRITVVENDRDPVSFPLGDVARVRVLGNGGADDINTRDLGIQSQILGGEGNDMIIAGSGPNVLRGEAGSDTIIGFNGNDTIAGGGGNDLLRGQRGNDEVRGDNGFDTIFGGAGFDLLRGGNNDDYMRGSQDNDSMFGDNGEDTVLADDGDDTIFGGRNRDTLGGGSGNDVLSGNGAGDLISGGSGLDLLVGGDGPDELRGGDGRDIMIGGADRDDLFGGNADDLLIAGTTNQSLADLSFIVDEWGSNNDYDQRVANIRRGSGRNNDRLNDENYFIGRNRNDFATVFNDFGFIDNMDGERGTDWFFAARGFGDDDFVDRSGDERLDQI